MKISIVTAVRNGAGTIRDCVASVGGQTVEAEHIILDGLSSDGTFEILRGIAGTARQGPRRAGPTVLRQEDRGMYDAMNKGIARADGDVVGILNADDTYADERVLEHVQEAFEDPAVASVYGDLVYVRRDIRGDAGSGANACDRIVRRWRAGPMSARAFSWGWMPPHPTFFVRRAIYEELGVFRLDLGTAADYELMLRFLVKHRITTRYMPRVLVKMRAGGASNASLAHWWRGNRQDRRAWLVNGLRPYPWTLFLKPVRKLPQFVLT